jgi:hypothetical protein
MPPRLGELSQLSPKRSGQVPTLPDCGGMPIARAILFSRWNKPKSCHTELFHDRKCAGAALSPSSVHCTRASCLPRASGYQPFHFGVRRETGRHGTSPYDRGPATGSHHRSRSSGTGSPYGPARARPAGKEHSGRGAPGPTGPGSRRGCPRHGQAPDTRQPSRGRLRDRGSGGGAAAIARPLDPADRTRSGTGEQTPARSFLRVQSGELWRSSLPCEPGQGPRCRRDRAALLP